jgi:hypothetical protein
VLDAVGDWWQPGPCVPEPDAAAGGGT